MSSFTKTTGFCVLLRTREVKDPTLRSTALSGAQGTDKQAKTLAARPDDFNLIHVVKGENQSLKVTL